MTKTPPKFPLKYTEGWDIFSINGSQQIQRIDDPQSVRPPFCECDTTHEQNDTCCMPCWEVGFRLVASDVAIFDSDQAAYDFVLAKANEGSPLHQIAIKLHKPIKIASMELLEF